MASVPAKVEIRYSYRNAPTLWRFSEDNSFVRGLMGPIGSGKSSAAAIEIVRRGLAQKPGPDGVRRTRWVIVRQSYKQLLDTTIKTFHQWFPPIHFGDWYASTFRYVIRAFPGAEIEVLFRALDRPDQVSNLLSLEVTGGWVNEAREVSWPIIEALQGRCGRYPSARDGGPTWYGVWLDTNPPDVDSEWYKFFEESEHEPGFSRIFKQPSGLADNAENIPNLPGGREYYLRLTQGKSAEWIKVYIHGQYGYVADGRPVFPEYNDNLHCVEFSPIPKMPIHISMDFGLTPAAAYGQVFPDGRWGIFDELTSKDMGVQRFAQIVKAHNAECFGESKYPPKFIWTGDPAMYQRAQTDEKSIAQILHAMEIPIEPGIQTMAIRLESMRKPMNTNVMGKPQFMVHPRCTVLRKGLMGAYRFRRLKVTGERFSDEPEKSFESHICEAVQYQATRIFGKEILIRQPTKGELARRRELDDEDELPDPRGKSDTTGY